MVIRALPWVAGVTLPPVAARMLPIWTGLAFLVAEFWTVIDWGAVRGGVAAHPAAAIVGLTAVSGASAAPVVRAALGAPSLRPLWRSPMSWTQRGLLAAVPAALAMSPALVAMALWPSTSWAAAAPVVLAPVVGPVGLPVVALAALHPLGGLLTPLSLWLAGRAMLRHRPREQTGAAPALRPRGPILALLTLDLLTLLRTGRSWVLVSLAPAVPLAGLAWGLRVNGGLALGERARAIGVLLCLVAPLVGAALGDLRRALGRRLDGPHLPVSATQRLLSLALVGIAVLSPTSVALAAVDPAAALHPTPGLAFGSLLAGALLVLAWARPGGRRPYSIGAQVAWCLGVVALVLWDSTGARLAQAAMAIFAAAGAEAGLRHGRRQGQGGR